MTGKKTRLHSSFVLAVAFLAMVCYFFVSFFNLRTQVEDRKQEVYALEKQVAEKEKDNETLEALLEKGDLDAFVEKRARDEDLGYVYPDERVYYDLAAGTDPDR